MKCKLCGAQLEADMTVCPLCGAKVDPAEGVEETPEAVSAPLTPEAPADLPETSAEHIPEEPEETLTETGETDEVSDEEPEDEDGKPENGKRRGSGKKLAVLIAVVVVVLAALVYAVVSIVGSGKNGDSDDPLAMNHVDAEGNFVAHTYTKANEEITEDEMNTVVATCGDYEMTNAQLSFYYWQQYYNFMSTYGSYASMFGLDTTLPLSEQMYDETNTWEDLFLQWAMNSFWQTSAANEAAKEAGYALDQDTSDYIDSLADSMAQEAEANGYESQDAYVQSAYGPYVTMDDYLEFGRQMMTASGYVNELYNGIEYTEDDITTYFEENLDTTYAEAGYTPDDPKMVNVRHILIEPVADEDAETDEGGNPILTDQNWADAKAKAEEIYDMWKTGEATEDSFAALAQEYSADPGSAANGGLYEEVYPGEMTTAFNDWCFDESRQVGDTGIVETDFGYHIMYFSGTSDHAYWYVVAEQDYLNERKQEILDSIMDSHPVKVDYDKVVLTSTEMLS